MIKAMIPLLISITTNAMLASGPITHTPVVAIIDTGADTNHSQLRTSLYRNPGEMGVDPNGHNKSTNGIDDDNNGFIDDIHGWNFAGNNHHLEDQNGHGTHIAGIIGGTNGVAPQAKLMILKYYDSSQNSDQNLQHLIEAIDYAVNANVDVINYSGGGTSPSSLEKLAIEKALQKNILFITAAGNLNSNTEITAFYPASYQLDNIISVASVDADNTTLSKFSNFGEQISIAAPGASITSSLPDDRRGTLSGTSQSTAVISGVAAKILSNMSARPLYTQLKRQILQTAQFRDELANKVQEKRVVDIPRATHMRSIDTIATGEFVTEHSRTQK